MIWVADANMVVRRAQEAVELTLKDTRKILGVDYPKIHDLGSLFSEQLQRKRGMDGPALLQGVEDVALWLAESGAPSCYSNREYAAEDAEKAIGDAAFVLNEVKRLPGLGSP